jgi:hypothetical protein
MGLIDTVAVNVAVRRYPNPGGQVDGRWVDDEDTAQDLVVKAAVQPAKPSEIRELPEGQRTSSALKLYSEVELFTADERAQKRADRVQYGGRQYDVKAVELIEGFGLKVYKSIAIEVDAPPESAVNPYA